MLLTWANRRLERAGAGKDAGVALPLAVAIVAVVLIISTTFASSTIAAMSLTTETRGSVQARAAADAGIDVAWAGMSQGTFYCAVPTVASIRYTTTVKYYDSASHQLACSGTSTVSGTPAKAVVTSVGRAPSGTAGGERTIAAIFSIVATGSTATLDKAIFSDGDTTLSNNVRIVDGTGTGSATIYSNEDVLCQTQVPVQGSIYTQGDFTGENQCTLTGSVWAGGDVSLSSSAEIGGDVLVRGGTTTPAATVTITNSAWIGGSLVSNGSVELQGNSNVGCPIAGYKARVCGSVVSIEGGVTSDGQGLVVGNVYANGNIALGNVNSAKIIGGNATSTIGTIRADNINVKGTRIGGYLAAGGSTNIAKSALGNQASSCASSTTGYAVCNPAHPPVSLAGLPAALNFPTNTRVVAPPRESIVRITSDAAGMAKWSGYTIESVGCTESAVTSRVAAGWSGKLLLDVTGCGTSPLTVDNKTWVLPGDLVLMSDAGFKMNNQINVKSSVSGTKRDFMMIVPSDSKLPNGDPLVTWTTPIPTDPSYTKPTCHGTNGYGNITFTNNTTFTDLKTFMYTPCTYSTQNPITGFDGQIYAGVATYPNNSTITYSPMNVPGASTATPVAASVAATQTARFDVRD